MVTGASTHQADKTARPLLPPDLAPHVRALLEREGVMNLDSWRSLGRKRLRIFGIPAPLARRLDELAKQVRSG